MLWIGAFDSTYMDRTRRKTCNSCKCPREDHEVYHDEWINVQERLGFKPSQDPEKRNSRDRCLQEGYSWVPPGLSSRKIEQYFWQLPESKVPKVGSPGEQYRRRQIMLQLPKQDLALAYCKHLDSAHHSSFQDFINARNEIALDIAYVKEAPTALRCPECSEMLKEDDVGVLAPKLGSQVMWHPACFVCSTCKQLLVDLTYCAHDQALYCERHYAEQLKPRCAACEELIFSGEYTKAMNKDWHSGHFCCWQCDESLTGQRYVLRDDHPYCIKCYESVFANPCEQCNKTIGIDSKDLSYKDKHWHEACFLCNKCQVSLVDKQFGSKGEKIYCGNCYDTQFASRCDGCTQIFRAVETTETQTNMATDVLSSKLTGLKLTTKTVGEERIKEAKRKNEDVAMLTTFMPGQEYKHFNCALGKECLLADPKRAPAGTKKMEYKTRQWHEQCFCCCVCKSPIGTKSFIPREQEIYCATCYEEKFATRCVKCNKIITSGGVTYKNEPWHRECFTCTNCSLSLAGQRFTSRDEKPYCADCFGELFAKRCTSCCKPITGIGGTRFISFEDRHWHNDCFICAMCKNSLVGRGFITDGDDIICPDCAKTKLM
ncbi:prickle planar cell polarity protein 3 isoform X6 [Nilaparvata lugens]|uniref:prickle planar cell polarity protein 3 isoform X6 n=1 Tax=Nilaparvata lugens TaxID=108931 RepID=UPI00193E01AA|nr:prickle planar cell polarity protein 3 isoform X6 [Nilaparvata lugens]